MRTDCVYSSADETPEDESNGFAKDGNLEKLPLAELSN